MKANSLLAFIFSLVALLMLVGLLGWLGYGSLSKIIGRPQYCQQFSADLKPESYSAILEVGQGKLIKVDMINNGFEDEFKIGVKGPKWVAARPLEARLDQGESKEIFVYISPTVGSEGEHTLTVFAKSYCGYVETEIKTRV